ncbi:MAG: 2-oxo-4-hydroxy-4-carboxy-5-ureidoimidazoline decarboxylase [Terracidiphilus sp.]|jgi:OHCU decarboxylase
MSAILAAWNATDEATALDAMTACCGARRWAAAMVALRPIESPEKLGAAADKIWSTMDVPDWMEAFACHPRIGERKAPDATAKSREWSKQEQSSAAAADAGILARLAEGNAIYEARFGFTYIVCATGKTAEEMLAILERRLQNDRETELRKAAEQQRQITRIRLRKWLAE